LTDVRSIGCGWRNEMSIRERKRVDLVGRIVPCGWGADVIETWRRDVVETWRGDVVETWRSGWLRRGPRG
jgi:hypothetical protein